MVLRRSSSFIPARLWILVALVISASWACSEGDPYLEIEQQRAQYRAEAQGFYVDERVVDAEPTIDAEGNEVSIEPTVEKDLFLDILVQNEADVALPGLTVDFEHVNSAGDVKDSRKFFLDTSGVGRGNVGQFSETLTNVDFVEGDGFAVSVRSPIPENERSQYREFDGIDGN